jgi:hypothetical protein
LGDKDFEEMCELEHRQFIVNHSATVKKCGDVSSADLEAGQLIGVRARRNMRGAGVMRGGEHTRGKRRAYKSATTEGKWHSARIAFS